MRLAKERVDSFEILFWFHGGGRVSVESIPQLDLTDYARLAEQAARSFTKERKQPRGRLSVVYQVQAEAKVFESGLKKINVPSSSYLFDLARSYFERLLLTRVVVDAFGADEAGDELKSLACFCLAEVGEGRSMPVVDRLRFVHDKEDLSPLGYPRWSTWALLRLALGPFNPNRVELGELSFRLDLRKFDPGSLYFTDYFNDLLQGKVGELVFGEIQRQMSERAEVLIGESQASNVLASSLRDFDVESGAEIARVARQTVGVNRARVMQVNSAVVLMELAERFSSFGVPIVLCDQLVGLSMDEPVPIEFDSSVEETFEEDFDTMEVIDFPFTGGVESFPREVLRRAVRYYRG
jgi:hypothetical protein